MTVNSVTPTVMGVRSSLSSLHFPFTFRLLSLSTRGDGFGRTRWGVGMAIKVTTCMCGFLLANVSAVSGALFNVGTEEVDGWGVRFLIQAFESRIELSFELALLFDISSGFLGIRGFCGSISAESGYKHVENFQLVLMTSILERIKSNRPEPQSTEIYRSLRLRYRWRVSSLLVGPRRPKVWAEDRAVCSSCCSRGRLTLDHQERVRDHSGELLRLVDGICV